MWAFFLDCAFRMLIGWANKPRSRGLINWNVFFILQHLFTFVLPLYTALEVVSLVEGGERGEGDKDSLG